MKKDVTLPRRKHYSSWLVMSLILCLLSVNSFGQNTTPALYLAWDKTSCQTDVDSKLTIDASLTSGYILRVCEDSFVSYRIIGEGMQNVSSVNWDIGGGTAETKDEFAAVKWDNSYQGYLSFQINFTDGTSIEKTIITRKFETDIALGWDKIGCQIDTDKVNEIKFSSVNNACLKVCKGAKVEYGLSGKDLENVHAVLWTITGGETETTEGLKSTISWNNESTGSIKIRLEFNNGATIEKTFCVLKLDSSILLEWEKIEESSLREFKLDNEAQEKDVIVIYPESTSFYKVGGKVLENLSSISWEIHGGFAYIENGFATPITWFNEEENYLVVHLTYNDLTTLDRRINIIKMERPGTGQLAPTSIKFSYDDAGNQIKREMIYLARHTKPQENNSGQKKWTKSDEYDGISYFPNPVKSELSVQWKEELGEDLKEMELYDLSGRMVHKIKNLSQADQTMVDFNQYPSGIYTLSLIYAGGAAKTLKIVKE